MIEEQQDRNELLSAEEAAARLKVSKKTVLRWAREGKLGSVRLSPKLIRFTDEQVAEFIRSMSRDRRPEKTKRVPPMTSAPYHHFPVKKDRRPQTKQTWKELRDEVRSWGKDEK